MKLNWHDLLSDEKEKPYFSAIIDQVNHEISSGKTVYPPQKLIFNALTLTPAHKVKVVILGQDPYHGPNQAHGLSFSVPQGINQPPSLKNIFKELAQDLNIQSPSHGCLEDWAKEGVLLLNSVLTVRAHEAGSHRSFGWEKFTDQLIVKISQSLPYVVFLLWGSYAQKKTAFIDQTKHDCLLAPHPSPLSAHRGFLGCGHFSKCNELLEKKSIRPINWQITE